MVRTPEQEAEYQQLRRDLGVSDTTAPTSRDPYPFAPSWAESLPFVGTAIAGMNNFERSSERPQSFTDYLPTPGKIFQGGADMIGGVYDTVTSGDMNKIADLTVRSAVPAVAGIMSGGTLALPVAAASSFLFDQFSQLIGGQKDTPLNEDLSRFTSTELPLMGAMDYGIRKAVPWAADTFANNIYTKETGFGGIKRAQTNEATLARAQQSPYYIQEQFPNRNIGDTTTGLDRKAVLAESEPGAIESGLFRGGDRIDVNPDSPTAGKFVGQEASTLSEMAPVLQSELPKLAQARDIALSRYDQAADLYRQAVDPNGPTGKISGTDVLAAPLESKVLDPVSGQWVKGSKPAAEVLAEELRQSVVTGEPTGSTLIRQAISDLKQTGGVDGLSLSDANLKRVQIDKQLRDLGAYNEVSNNFGGMTKTQVEGLIHIKTLVRNAWSSAIQKSVELMHQTFKQTGEVDLNVPSPEYIKAMTDGYHNLSPYSDAISGWAERVNRGVRNQPVDGPRDPALPALNVAHATTGPTGLVNRAATWAGNKLLQRSPQQAAIDAMTESQAYDTRALSNIQTAIENTSRNPNGAPTFSEYTPRQRTTINPKTRAIAGGALDASVMRGDAQIQQPNMTNILQRLPDLVAKAHAEEPELSPIKAPDPLSVALTPQRPEAREGFQIPRNMRMVDPQGVSNLLLGYVEPERVMPLVSQWRRVTATGDKKQMASFLGALSESYPDFPLSRGPVTGLPSEFDIGDGKTRLFSPTDIAKWEQEIDKSPLREDEKAQRIIALRKDGIVVPFTTKINTISDEEIAKSPENRAMQHLQKTYQFKPREQGAYGSRRLDG